jgi:RecA-family ATPase
MPRPNHTWIVHNLLPASGLLNIYGPPKGGKSYAALQLAYAVAGVDEDWFGFDIEQHGPVLYLQLDTPRSLWQARLFDDFLTSAGLDGSRVHIADRDIAPFPFDILRADSGGRWLTDTCKTLAPVVVIIDTLRECSQANENDSGEMKNVINGLVATIAPAACVLVSHSKKDNMTIPAAERDQLMHDNRGSSYVAGRMDGVIKITEKSFHFQSRTCEKGKKAIERDHTSHLWHLKYDEINQHISLIHADPTLLTIADRAHALASLTGKKYEACRKLIIRKT